MDDLIKSFIDKLKNWILNNGVTQQTRTATSSWIMGIAVAAVSAVVLAYYYYMASKKGKEIAKLKHESDVNKEKALQIVENTKINATKEEIQAALEEIHKHEEIIKETDVKIKEWELAHANIEQEINAIKNWDDVDIYLSKHSSSGDSKGN